MKIIESIRFLIESRAFGVCERIGEKLEMPARNIRLFFIYVSFLAVGSPVILYLILMFWMRLREYIRSKRNPVWDF